MPGNNKAQFVLKQKFSGSSQIKFEKFTKTGRFKKNKCYES
jgi:hypothetical protein